MTCTQKRGPWSSSISIRSLEPLFQPGSVAVIGASDRPQSLGAKRMRNLLEGGFARPIWPVNPKHFVSPGDSADVDFGDVLDYLGSDPGTRAILMYIESVQAARKFMSAARAAARSKPVLLVKAGRAPEGAKAAASHTGALAGSDAVFDAAVRRAGMLRVAPCPTCSRPRRHWPARGRSWANAWP